MPKQNITLYDTTELVAPSERTIDDVTIGLAGGDIDGGLKRLSLKGSRFRRIVGGEEVDVSGDNSMEIAIIASAPSYIRTFYAGAYVEGENADPGCWSDDCEAPSPNCDTPEAKRCVDCKQNVVGSSSDGKSRACRYGARMAVVLGGDLSGDVYGLQVAATSIFGNDEKDKYLPLQAYARKLASHNYVATKVITEIAFDTDSPVPRIMFRPLRALSDDELDECVEQAKTSDAAQHTGPRKFDTDTKVVNDGEDDDLFVESEKPKKVVKKRAAKKAAPRKKAAAKKVPEPEVVVSEKPEVLDDDDVSDLLESWADDD